MFDKFVEGINNELNVSVTENGALGYKTTGKDLLDFNFKVASYRTKSDEDIIVDFKKAWYENKELALKFLFYARDIREGLGERRLFRVCIKDLVKEIDNRVFDWIAEYGRYDDLFVFFNTEKQNDMMEYVRVQLMKDMENCIANKNVSLLAKWMPSVKTSSEESMAMARKFIKYFNSNNEEEKITQKTYRKTLSRLRAYIDVIEKKQCANKWDEINYETVPSMANLKYKDAFLKHDTERRKQYLASLEKGESKINASVTYPHNIVNKYLKQDGWYNYSLNNYDQALESMWKSLPDYVKGNANTLVVRDGSGSMTSEFNGVRPLDISTALAIYFSEKCEGVFKDKFITFSAQPKFISLENYSTLRDKLQRCYKEDDCSNTDIEATFDLVLKTAVKNNLKQEEIPNLLIISDMEFDAAHNYYQKNDKKLFEVIAKKYAAHGYMLPKLIFWNVSSRTATIPVKQNENGVILVSGYSASICKMVLQEETDPYKALLNVLNSERYKQITVK